jgi:hypothetical protein
MKKLKLTHKPVIARVRVNPARRAVSRAAMLLPSRKTPSSWLVGTITGVHARRLDDVRPGRPLARLNRPI